MTTISPTTRKPAWRLLPCIVAVMGALLAVIERFALPPAMRTILQIAVTAGGFSMIGFWIRCNRIAMALEEWREENRRPSLGRSRPGGPIEARRIWTRRRSVNNDTIVTYDRLREIRSRTLEKGVIFAQQANRAINQTLSRTVLTVATVAMSAAMLFFFGGPSLENVAFVVLVGAITGTLATVYVAIALVVDWTEWADRGSQTRVGARGRVGGGVARP